MFFSSLEKNSSLEQNGLKYSILFKFISLHYISYTALHVCVCVLNGNCTGLSKITTFLDAALNAAAASSVRKIS